MKSKVLVSSILTIALCLSLIAGSTFALFTDQTQFGIEVTSGDVEINAHAHIAAVYSAQGAANDVAEDEYLEDEKGHGYNHVDPKDVVAGIADNTFINGGNAVLNGSNLVLNRVTPGDRVDVTIKVDNESNVAMVYRYKLIADESNLAYGMVVSVGDNTTNPNVAPTTLEAYEGLATWTSKWYPVIPAVDGTPSAIPDYTFSIELPVYAGNEYQSEKTAQEDGRPAGEQSVSYTVLVEAVQGNAVTDDESEVTIFPEAVERHIAQFGEYAFPGVLYTENDETLDLGGKAVSVDYLSATGDVKISNGTIVLPKEGYVYTLGDSNIVLENVVISSEDTSVMAYTGGTITLKNVTFESATTSNPLQNYGGTLILDNVKVTQEGDANTAWYSSALQVVNEIVKDTATGKYKVISQANTTVNSGEYVGKKALMISAPGGNVTINGGNFVGSEYAILADFAPQNYDDGANYESIITINGGNFDGKIKVTNAVELKIYGGTFTVDPSAWVAPGFKALQNGSQWMVLPENYDVVVNNADQLQAALDAATGEYDIYVNANIVGNVKVTQKADTKITIDGNGYIFNGVMTVFGGGRKATAGLTIKDINFVAAAGADACIVSPAHAENNAYSYASNVTVEGCTFTDPDGVVDCAAVRQRSAGDTNWKIIDCTVDSTMHSLAQLANINVVDGLSDGLLIQGCEVYSKNGINLNNCTKVSIVDCEIDVKGYAVRYGVGGSTVNGTFEIKESTLKSANDDGDAVIIFRGNMAGSTLTITDTDIVGTPDITGNANVVYN